MAKQLARVVDILTQISGVSESMITPRTKLIRDLSLDSLSLFEVEYEIRIEFGVDLEIGRSVTHDISVQDILNKLNDRLEESGPYR